MVFKEHIKKIIIFLDYLLWAIFDFSKFKKIKLNKIKKVVIIHRGAIGELLATTPIARALKEKINCDIHYMIRPEIREVFKYNPNITGFLPYSKNMKENFQNLKKEKFDLAIILWPGSLNLTLACLFAGIKYRVGCFKMVKEGPAFFYTRRWFPLKGNSQHSVESNVDMLKLIGLENKNPKIEFYYEKSDENKVNLFLKKNKLKRFVILHPGFGGKNKNKSYSRYWPEEIYADICNHLSKKNKKIILTGIKEEKEIAEKIILLTKSKSIINTCGMFSLQELAALVKKAELVIAPDTSIVHIASSYGTKVVDLIGDSNPVLWHPWMEKEKYRIIRHPYFDNLRLDSKRYNDKSKEIKIAINELL